VMNCFHIFAFKLNLRRYTKDLKRAEEEAARTLKAGWLRLRMKPMLKPMLKAPSLVCALETPL